MKVNLPGEGKNLIKRSTRLAVIGIKRFNFFSMLTLDLFEEVDFVNGRPQPSARNVLDETFPSAQKFI